MSTTFRTARGMTLMGRDFKRGEIVPAHVVAEIPEGRLRSLRNVGMLKEVVAEAPQPEQPEAPEAEVETHEDGVTCAVCGKGPFKRLDRHMTTHEQGD